MPPHAEIGFIFSSAMTISRILKMYGNLSMTSLLLTHTGIQIFWSDTFDPKRTYCVKILLDNMKKNSRDLVFSPVHVDLFSAFNFIRILILNRHQGE